MTFRLPLAQRVVVPITLRSPALTNPEAAFWYRLVRGGDRSWHAEPPDALWIRVASVDCWFGLVNGLGSGWQLLSLRLHCGPAVNWLVHEDATDDESLFRALALLLDAWPAGRKRLERDDRGWGWVIHVGPVPPDRGGARVTHPRDTEAIVATALWELLQGQPPEEAILRAHREPLWALTARGEATSSSYVVTDYRLGPVAFPDELSWLYAPVLADACWRRGELLDGFRVVLVEDRGAEVRVDAVYTGAGSPGDQGPWVPVFGLHFLWEPVNDEGAEHAAFRIDLVREQWNSAVRPELPDGALVDVVHAWPAGEKVLFVSRQRVLRPALLEGVFAPVVAVRLRGAEPAHTVAVLEKAAQMAAEGTPVSVLAEWLAALGASDAAGVAALQALAR